MQRKAWHNTYSSHSYCTNLQFWELKQRNRHSNNAKEESSFESRQKQDLYLVYRASRPALGSKQAHKKLVPAARSRRHSGLALDLTYNVHLVQRSIMSTSTHTHTHHPDAIKVSAATTLPFPRTLPFQHILNFVNI